MCAGKEEKGFLEREKGPGISVLIFGTKLKKLTE